MTPPLSASRHNRRLQRLQAITVLALRRIWSQLNPAGSWERDYEDNTGPQLLAILLAAQLAAVREGDIYIAEILNELGFGPPTEPGVVLPAALVGVTGDGRQVETLLATSVGRARAIERSRRVDRVTYGPPDPDTGELQVTIDRPATVTSQQQALAQTQQFIDTVAQSVLSDAMRAAETVAMAQRPWVDGWVRMINPPCCSRCAVLSGKYYRFSEGFDRHPRCDCFHVPAPAGGDQLAGLVAINSPERYFESLTTAEQDKTFTQAGADAIRQGADIGKVVNARRGGGMSRAQVYGRDVLVTTEGTYRPGRRRTPVRLMPETILQLAGEDRDEQIRLLKLNGFIN